MNLHFIHQLTTFGDSPDDSDEDKLNHSLLIYVGIAMSIGGIIWGSICWAYDLTLQATIPYGYGIATLFNFIIFRIFKSFVFCKNFQVFISILLPFLFQWTLGGIVPSGAVMLWAVIALISMITVQNITYNIFWLIFYLVLVIISGLIDHRLISYGFNVDVPEVLSTIFFSLNIGIISFFAVGLNIFFVKRYEVLQNEMKQSEQQLQAIVQYIGKAIISIDKTGTIVFVNKEMSDMFGYTEEELKGQNINIILREKRREQSNPLMKKDERYIYYLLKVAKGHLGRKKDGTTLPVKVDLSTMDMEKDKMYVGIIYNITTTDNTDTNKS